MILNGNNSRTRPLPRTGLTLLELLLVLMLIVVVSAMVVPRLTGIARRRELAGGANDVRTALTKARNTAMRLGETVMFLYQPESRMYVTVLAPTDAQSQATFELAQSTLAQLSTLTEDVMMRADLSQSASCQSLPIDVFFQPSTIPSAGAPAAASVAGTNTGSSSTGTNSGMGAGTMQSATPSVQLPAVTFYPDGSAEPAVVTIRDFQWNQIAVVVRGLTGGVTVSEVMAPGEGLMQGAQQ